MANENAPLGRIDPSSLIGQFKPQTDATSNFVQAIRAGVVNANDIVQGIDRHQQAKAELTRQQLALQETMSPEAVEARQAQTALATATAKAQLPLVQPIAQMQKDAAMGAIWGSHLKAMGSSAEEVMHQNALGFNVPMDYSKLPDSGLLAMIQKNRETIQRHEETGKYFASEIEGGKLTVSPEGRTVVTDPRWKNQQRPLTKEEGDAWEAYKRYSNPVEWDRAKRPGESLWMGLGAGQVTSPRIVAVGSQLGPAIEAMKVATAPSVPQQPAPVVAPKESKSGILEPVPGVHVSIGPESTRAPTETQQRALQALARMGVSDVAIADLAKRGFDPSAWSGIILSRLPDFLKPENWQAYDQAIQSWAQGILRLESGAAISAREEGWYKRAFFIRPGDKPQTIAQKDKLRREMEMMVAQIGQAGPIPEELKQEARRVYAAAEKLAPLTQPTITQQKTNQPTFNLKGGTITLNPDGTITKQ